MTGSTRDFTGKTAFITGGVNGIGFGIARAFALAGMDLILTYRKDEDRDDAARWLADNGLAPARFVRLDVTDRARFAQVAAEVGKVHVLVNNAGVSVFGPTDEASYDDYDWIMGVNFGGVVNGLVSFLPGMKAHGEGGHVVNVASMAAYLSGPQAGIYTASKFAVRGLTECLRYNLAPHGIGVSLMCPGLTRTNAWTSALKRPDSFAESGFKPADATELEQFGTAFELGMDPFEVGQKTLAGMIENRGLILTHGEFADDFEEIYRTSLAALPQEVIPEGRLHIEALRRAANKAAAEGQQIGLADLT
ncbi:short-chain dehydrogenase/reductase SDR [Novosphingobium aromaticivorans DSM 12444]|uniref:Short-chain dehydrogenase/reductase SDR n=1 Tax=Novosphingobium aromaticivorans (strain ATCC 700278 / DSM 12444 / CCUG 56034 / CIP 105152 / NBRC 16084 / F199) TaxID=279238 RepID=Q2GAH3_NOVAD|nr:SDR family oxidoreductase [Novosphingobium aromaticivorans]ABD25150.1 short-chain dehydrogenase/reductase SDR [Novosphingobium aromaticivorans DSM 12444]SCX85037.1 Short-chain dehydrogenase [Novosphingobium aromaticivorans]